MVIGGFYDGSPTNMVQTIDFSTNEIKKIASLNKNRYSHACAVAIWGEEEYIVAAGSIFLQYSCCYELLCLSVVPLLLGANYNERKFKVFPK